MGQIVEYIKIALMNIRHNKGRSILTMLGIIIGIASVIMIISVGNGLHNSVSGELNSIAGGQIYVSISDQESGKEFTQEAALYARLLGEILKREYEVLFAAAALGVWLLIGAVTGVTYRCVHNRFQVLPFAELFNPLRIRYACSELLRDAGLRAFRPIMRNRLLEPLDPPHDS